MLNRYLQTSHRHLAETTVARLSSREREVVQLVSEGSITKQVASTLHVSVKTVETHRTNIMRKLGVHSIAELVLYAVRNNIVQRSSSLAAENKPAYQLRDLFTQEDRQWFIPRRRATKRDDEHESSRQSANPQPIQVGARRGG